MCASASPKPRTAATAARGRTTCAKPSPDCASGKDSEGPLWLGDDTLVGSLWRTLAGRPFVAEVRFGEPQEAQGRDRRAWAQDLRDAVDALRSR